MKPAPQDFYNQVIDFWASHAKYVGGRFHETVHPDHYAWYSPSTLRRLLADCTTAKDKVEMFFIDNQSMVGARVTRERG